MFICVTGKIKIDPTDTFKITFILFLYLTIKGGNISIQKLLNSSENFKGICIYERKAAIFVEK